MNSTGPGFDSPDPFSAPQSYGEPPRTAGSLRPEKPTSMTVFGVLNIVFGALGICGGIVGTASLFMTDLFNRPGVENPMAKIFDANPGYRAFLIGMACVGLVMAFVEILGGVGLLQGKSFGRSMSLIYGYYAIVGTLVGTLANILFVVVPMMNDAAGLRPGSPEKAGAIGGAIGGVVGGCIGLIYPILLVIFMYRPSIRKFLSDQRAREESAFQM